MKKFLILAGILAIPSIGFAREDALKDRVHRVDSYVSQGVYYSTNTNAATLAVQVSSYPALVHSVTVNTAGTSSVLEIYDATHSTLTSTNARRIAKIDTTAKGLYTFDVYLSSGLCIYNYGSTPADITVTYREK